MNQTNEEEQLLRVSSCSLRKEILNYDEALKAYERMSTDADMPHLHFSLCLASWLSDINRRLREYVDDLDKGECREVLGIDFMTMTRKDYWLKSGRLKKKMQGMKDIVLKDYGLVYRLNGQEIKDGADIFEIIEKDTSNLVALLKEAKKKTMNAPIALFSKFYQKLGVLIDEEPVTAAYEEWKMNQGILTFERLKGKQAKVVADFLKKDILCHADTPTEREIEEVRLDLVRKYMPCDYEYPLNFKKHCALFRRFISWEGDILRINYGVYGKYLYKHFYKFSLDDIMALYTLDKSLKLIHDDMEELMQDGTLQQKKVSVKANHEQEGIIPLLKPIFFGNEDEVRLFLDSIQGMRPKQITDTVNKLVSDKKMSELSCHRELYMVLHEYGIYQRSESNWNMQVR